MGPTGARTEYASAAFASPATIRCMVVRECVADRAPAVTEANLFDVHQKYADVVTLSEAMDYLDAFAVVSRAGSIGGAAAATV